MQVGFTETHRDGSNDRQFHGYEPVDVDDVRVPAWLKDEPAARVELANLGGSLRALDDAVGRIVAAVDKHGLTGETLIVFTVDHGLPFPRAKTACYDPGIEVATIFRGPGVAAGTGVDGLTSNVDLLPTILDIAGLPIPQQVQGRSLAGPLRGGSNPGAVDAIFAEMTYHNYVDPIRAIRTATHKLIVNFMPTAGFYNCTQQWRPRTQASVDVAEPAGMHPLVEVYDLDADALEHHNLADDPQHAAVREQLLKRLREHLHSTGDPLLEGLPLPVRFSEAQALLRAAEG
jgi:arylsulfatase A-like enzyme